MRIQLQCITSPQLTSRNYNNSQLLTALATVDYLVVETVLPGQLLTSRRLLIIFSQLTALVIVH